MFQTFEVKPYVDVTLRGRFGDTESSYTLEGSSTTDTIDYDVSGSQWATSRSATCPPTRTSTSA